MTAWGVSARRSALKALLAWSASGLGGVGVGVDGTALAQQGGALPKGTLPGASDTGSATGAGATKPGPIVPKTPKETPKTPKAPASGKGAKDAKAEPKKGAPAAPVGKPAKAGAPAKAAAPTKAAKPKPPAGGGNGALPPGALPKGNLEQGGTKEPPKAEGEPTKSCWQDYATVPGGNALWTLEGDLFLLAQDVAKAGKKSGGKGAGGVNALVRHTLFLVHPKARTTEPVLSLDLKPSGGSGVPSLVMHGTPISGVSAVVFSGAGNPCFEGPATVVSIALPKGVGSGEGATPTPAPGAATTQGPQAVNGKGDYQLVEVPGQRWLVDRPKKNVVQLDPVTFQSKFFRRLPGADRPLWLETRAGSGRRLVTWHDDGKQRGLVAHASEEDKAPKRLAFAKGDRVTQDFDRFAAVRSDTAKNTLTIRELPEWSKVEKPGVYTLKIPPVTPVATSSLSLRLAARLALVQGTTILARQQWQRAYLFDYAKGKLITELTVAPTQYVHFGSLDPAGGYAVFEIRDRVTRRSLELRVFSLKKGVFTTVPLQAP
jgi:hypothetical protein